MRLGLACTLGVLLLMSSACERQGSQSELPIAPAPDPVVPEPTMGTMVATINGEAWQSTVKHLDSGAIFDDPNRFFLLGQGDHEAILIDLPGRLPRTGTYPLASGGASGHAALVLVQRDGHRNYHTGPRHRGFATITRVDDVRVAGYFTFDASTDSAGDRVYDIRDGAFNVPLSASAASATTSPVSAPARLP